MSFERKIENSMPGNLYIKFLKYYKHLPLDKVISKGSV